jgi:hypothetical protein
MLNTITIRNNFINYFKDAFSIDLRALAVFRIGLGITLIFFLYNLCQDITMFFTDNGLVSRTELIQLYSGWPLNWRYSIYLLSGKKIYFILLFVIQFISAILFTIGYKTRLNCFISWFLLLSLQNRNYYIMSGFDLYLRLLLFWAMFLPLNTKYAIDNLFFKQKFNNNYFSLATFAILLQIALFYFLSSLLKTGSDQWWVNHTALNYILHNELYLTPFGYLIHNFFPNLLLHLVVCIVLLIEFLTPFILFLPCSKKYRSYLRILWFIVLFLLHTAFRVLLYIGPFFLICAVAIVILLPENIWDKFEQIINKIINKISTKINSNYTRYIQANPNSLLVKWATKINTYHNIIIKYVPKQPIRLNLDLFSKLFVSISIAAVIFINYTSLITKYRTSIPGVHEFSEVFGLAQHWGFFDQPATISHMLRFYGIDASGNERQLWPISGYKLTNNNPNIREYFYRMPNSWWWKYFTSFSIPGNNYNYFRENALIRALCYRENIENSDKNLPPIKRLKILYDWYPQIYDPSSSELTKYGSVYGRYYIQFCP